MKESLSKKKKHRKINNAMIVVILITVLSVLVAFGINIYNVVSSDTGEGETVEVEKAENKLKNAYYTVGNNPTEVNKTYFMEITEALDSANDETPLDEQAVVSGVVKTFITEYYTWTNKDGNYDIGGMQYIYQPKQEDFEAYTLANFYSDMDLYLTQIGREHLMEVESVTINSVNPGAEFVSEDQSVTLACYDVDASWTYVGNENMDVNSLQNHAYFRVANNNGRFEIVGIHE